MLASFSAPFLFGKSLSTPGMITYYDTANAAMLGQVLSSTSTFGYETLNLINTWTSVTTSLGSGTQVVYFNTMTSNTMTVRIVGAGGYSTVEAASTASNNFDVIFVTKSYNTTTGTLAVDTSTKNNLTLGLFVETGYTSALTVTMGAGIKNLYLYGNSSISVNGNSLDNIIVGNLGTSTINSLGGNDILVNSSRSPAYGGTEIDIIVGLRAGNSSIQGQGGNDLLYLSSISTSTSTRLTAFGGSGNDTFILSSYPGATDGIRKFLVSDLSGFDKVDFSYIFNSDGSKPNSVSTLFTGRASFANGATTFDLSNLLINYKNTTSTGAVTMTTGSEITFANVLPASVSSVSTITSTTSTTFESIWNDINTNTNLPVIY